MKMIDTHQSFRQEKFRFAKGTTYIFLSQAGFIFFSYLMHFGLSRLLNVSAYGNFGIVISILSIFLIFLNSGIPDAVSKYVAEQPYHSNSIKNKAIRIQIVVGSFLFLIYFFSAPFLSKILNDPSLIIYFRISAFVLISSAFLGVYMNYLNGLKAFCEQAAIGLLRAFLRVLLVLSLTWLGFGLTGAVSGFSLTSFIVLVIALLMIKYRKKFQQSISNFKTSKLIKFAIPSIIFSGAITLLLTMDLLFVKNLIIDKDASGFYTSATMFAKIPFYLFMAFPITLLPAISSSISKNSVVLTKKYIKNSMRFLFIILTPITFIISGTSVKLITLFYPSQYSAAEIPLSILIFGMMFFSIFTSLCAIIKGSGKPQIAMFIAIFLIPLDVSLNLILIPTFQLKGAALASSISMFSGMSIAMGYIFWKYQTITSMRSLIKIILSSGIIYLILKLFAPWGFLLLPYYLILLILYFILLLLLKEISKNDIYELKAMAGITN